MQIDELQADNGATEQVGTLPNLIVIGAQKCGTTSLHRYLALHPQIIMSETKELNFFVESRRWGLGVDWYRSNFRGQARIYGESSPGYTFHPIWPGVPHRMHSIIPEARLIYLVRDPIERLLAHYVHRFADGVEERPLAEVLAVLEPNPYTCLSQYHRQMTLYLEFYELSRILILDQSTLKYERKQALQIIYRFLEVDENFSSPLTHFEDNRTRDKRRLTPRGRRIAQGPVLQAIARLPLIGWRLKHILLRPFSKPVHARLNNVLRQQLMEFFKPDTDRFRQLTGQAFSDWSI